MSVATDGRRLVAPGGSSVDVSDVVDAGLLARRARSLVPGRELVIHVHESASSSWKLPATLPLAKPGRHPLKFVAAADDKPGAVRVLGDKGAAVLPFPSPVHLAFPTYSGDFAGARDVDELLAALELFRDLVGMTYLHSAPATVHKLINARGAIGVPPAEPEIPDYRPSAYGVPAHVWCRELTKTERARSHVRVLDRSGSYLAAWSGCVLSDGDWREFGPGRCGPGPESSRPPGYWLVDVGQVRACEPELDPFARHGGDDGLAWLTTPLLQLAVELCGDIGVTYRRAFITEARCRPLDGAAKRLSSAREQLAHVALGDAGFGVAALVFAVIKRGYAGAVQWLESLEPDVPLKRPHWKRTIVDRHVANTWRSFGALPFGWTEIDACAFAVQGAEGWPEGLRRGTALGAWKPKRAAVTMAAALEALEVGGLRALVDLVEGVGELAGA